VYDFSVCLWFNEKRESELQRKIQGLEKNKMGRKSREHDKNCNRTTCKHRDGEGYLIENIMESSGKEHLLKVYPGNSVKVVSIKEEHEI